MNKWHFFKKRQIIFFNLFYMFFYLFIYVSNINVNAASIGIGWQQKLF